MSEENNDADAKQSAGTAESATFDIERIYAKDISFESPLAPSLFAEANEVRPEVALQLNAESRNLADSRYEVVLVITLTATHEGQTAWLIEIKQAGVFVVAGVDEQTRLRILNSYCPAALFPYAREAVADMLGKGGLPTFQLTPINFDALYAQHMQQQAAGNAPAPETTQ